MSQRPRVRTRAALGVALAATPLALFALPTASPAGGPALAPHALPALAVSLPERPTPRTGAVRTATVAAPAERRVVRDDDRFVPGEVIVAWSASANRDARAAARASVDGEHLRAISDDIEVLRVPAPAVRRASQVLASNEAVSAAQPNYIVQAAASPNDPRFGEQRSLEDPFDRDIDAVAGWEYLESRAFVSTLVAVIDSGIDVTHPDLQGAIWQNPGETGPAGTLTDCTPNDGVPPVSNGSSLKQNNGYDDDCNGVVDDVNGANVTVPPTSPEAGRPYATTSAEAHGTEVAGLLAAVRNNSIGIAGAAGPSNVEIASVRATTSASPMSFTIANQIAGLQYAIKIGARVVNGSFGGVYNVANPYPVMTQLMADTPSTAFVFAAGNEGVQLGGSTGNWASPCTLPASNIICVGNSTLRDERAPTSNYSDTEVDLFALGTSVLTLQPNGIYGMADGTSMSAPIVAGAAANLLSLEPQLTGAEVRQRLINGTDPMATPGVGVAGRLNMSNTLQDTQSTPGFATATVSQGTLRYVASAGGYNRPTITGSAGTYVIQDSTTVLTPLSGCVAVTVRSVRCTGVASINVATGDLGDEITARVPIPVTVNAGSGAARVSTGDAADSIVTGEGADTISAGGGADTVDSGAGDDSLNGDAGDDILRGGPGNDLANGLDGNDVVIGGTGADANSGGAGDDVIDERGDDFSADRVSGGTGTDRAWYARTQAVTVTLDGVGNDGSPSQNEKDFVTSDVENLEGGDGNDTLIGNASANRLVGGLGSDTLRGGEGTDTYVAGLESTRADSAFTPCNTCADGTDDAVSYEDRTAPVTASIDGVANDGVSGEVENVPAGIDAIFGGAGADVLFASATGTKLVGGLGADQLRGGAGPDRFVAKDGVADSVTCGGGTDSGSADLIDTLVDQPNCESVSKS